MSLNGRCEVIFPERKYICDRLGLLVINPSTLYQVACGKNAGALLIQIPDSFLKLSGFGVSDRICCWYSDGHSDFRADHIREALSQILRVLFEQGDNAQAEAAEKVMSLLMFLRRYFFSCEERKSPMSSEVLRRLERVLGSINENWSMECSLSELASREFVSTSYLSHLFTKYLHTTFTEYVVSVRLDHALRDLYESDLSVTDIALNNGFRSADSFITYFRNRFGKTPGKFRRDSKNQFTDYREKGVYYDRSEWIESFLEETGTSQSPRDHESRCQYRVLSIDASHPREKVKLGWHTLLNIGYAHDGLLADVQKQILKVQKEIGFKYLRFHGIFDGDMHVCIRKSDGDLYYCYYNVDLLLDFILEVGLIPFIELGYMPPALARRKIRAIDRETYKGVFNDEKEWTHLIQNFLEHVIGRYGRECVRKWKFSMTSINYVDSRYYNDFNEEDYYKLYSVTYQSLKNADPKFCVGAPGGFSNLLDEGKTLESFFRFASVHKCLPDFFTFQCYPCETTFKDELFTKMTLSQKSNPAILSRDQDFTRHSILRYEKYLRQYGYNMQDIVAEEWNSTLWQRDLCGDTCFKAAWFAKNICENADLSATLGYWLMTDYLEEHADIPAIFHGGYGLFTYNGIPKAGYYALCMLRQIGDERVDSGPGWFLTEQNGTYYLLLYHYCHYGNLYRFHFSKPDDVEEAYHVFNSEDDLKFQIVISCLPAGHYRISTRNLNRENGSSYDLWALSGADPTPAPATVAYLRAHALPVGAFFEADADPDLHLTRCLKPHEICLVQITSKDA